jgi:hypothetical protein
MPTVGYSTSSFISSAKSVKDLGGWFGQLGGGAEVGTGTVGGDVSTGQSASNRQVSVLSGGVGQSIDLPWFAAGFEIHGMATYTWPLTLFNVHL